LAGQPPAAPGSTAPPAAESAWAPLRHPVFRWLWLGLLVSSVGTWMQTVGAQWYLVNAPNASTLVALVQTASTLPVVLLALPGGVLADSLDRRWLLLCVQVYLLAVGALLAVLTALGGMPPGLLLAFTFALGAGVAVQGPTWQAIIPELVPRAQLKAAAALGSVSVNVARALGPAIAGVVIALLGVPAVFAANGLSVVPLGLALLLWRRPAEEDSDGRERFLPALRAGGRYVRFSATVRRLLARAALFIAPAMSLWALLPLIATQRLHLGASGYGVLLAALGVGAIAGVFVLAPLRRLLSSNRMIGAASLLFGVALALVAVVSSFPLTLAVLLLAGVAWVAVLSTLNAELQLFLPAWVRARALAVYLVVLFGSQAAGAFLLGLLAQHAGLQAALFLSALVMAGGVGAGAVWPLQDTSRADPRTVVYWPEPNLAFEPEPDSGPVVVLVEYSIPRDREPAFLEAMESLRRSRLRTGATRWDLLRDGERPRRFVEVFTVPSWEEHLRQHEGRLTGTDQEIEERASSLSDPAPRVEHLFPPEASP
jgi:MFS family permease